MANIFVVWFGFMCLINLMMMVGFGWDNGMEYFDDEG
jgi:hypothetical protein